MKNKEKFYSTTLALIALIFFLLISFLSVTITATAQSTLPVGQFAYITNSDSNNVSVIDTATDTVTATVNVGTFPRGVAVKPDGTEVFVTNSESSTVSAINTTTNTVTANKSGFFNPCGIAVSPEGTKLYVANQDDDSIDVINTTIKKVIDWMEVSGGGWPSGVAVTPDGRKVYVTNFGTNTVSVIDTTTHDIDTVTVGKNPFGIAVNPVGTKVYVTNLNLNRTDSVNNTISVIDTTMNTVTATINVGAEPAGITVTPDGTKVYVTNSGDNTTSVIDTITNTVIATVTVGKGPFGVAVTTDGTKAYVANSNDNTISVIDTTTNKVTATVPVGRQPIAFGQFITPKTSIKVISPNGSENWQAGTIQEIKWKYTRNPGRNVKIELLKGRSLNSIINSNTSIGNDGTGSYEWLIPLNKMPGNEYKVRITSLTNSAYNDSSNENLSISSPSPICNTSTISGYSFNDSNGNKILDEGENGLHYWTINLNGFDTCKGTPINKTMETNSTGYFTFEVVDPGNYVILENTNIGWFPTTDAFYAINVPSNSTRIRRDFGSRKLAS